MGEVSTDSYPKPAGLPVQKSALDQAQQWGGLQQQQQQIQSGALTIDKQKLDLINTQFGLMNAELSTLANDPSITKEQAAKRLKTFADTYKFPPQVSEHMMGELQAAPNVPAFAKTALTRGMAVQERVNNLYGTPGSIDNGQTNTPVVTSPMMNGGLPKPVGLPIQQQIPPGQPVIGSDNRPTLQGPTPAVTPPGTAAGPSPLPVAPLPPTRNPSINNPQNTSTISPNQVVQDRGYPAPSGPATGMAPLFDEGKKQYVEDQNLAAAKLTDIKPAELALGLMKDLRSGPGTPTWNHAIALLKANNIIPTQTKDDPTAIYQEFTKYANQYVQKNGSRSDADLAQREASNPNAGVQINPALEKLFRSQIARDKIEAARSAAFGSNDYSKYGEHKASFPNKMDQRAFEINHMDPKERNSLLKDMQKKLDSKNPKDRAEAQKFRNSLEIADKQGLIQ